jgi:hypothetical protein
MYKLLKSRQLQGALPVTPDQGQIPWTPLGQIPWTPLGQIPQTPRIGLHYHTHHGKKLVKPPI